MKVKKLLPYGVTTLIGAAITVGVMSVEGLFEIPYALPERLMVACDAFFVAGILLTMFGVLFWIANTGLFDSLAYAFHVAAHIFLPFFIKDNGRKSFYDYKVAKAEKRAPTPMFVLHVGVVYLAISLILLAVWFSQA